MIDIYLWFYCLPIYEAAFIVFCISGVFLRFHKRFSGRLGWKLLVGCTFLLWMAAVAWVTVLSREIDPSKQEFSIMPLASYWEVLRGGNVELLRANFMNTVLFFPGGMLLGALMPEQWDKREKILLCCLLFFSLSVGIEAMQYFARIGMAETDDVLHNTLGATLGCLCFLFPFFRKDPQ